MANSNEHTGDALCLSSNSFLSTGEADYVSSRPLSVISTAYILLTCQVHRQLTGILNRMLWCSFFVFLNPSEILNAWGPLLPCLMAACSPEFAPANTIPSQLCSIFSTSFRPAAVGEL
ncbi:hypothetical protein VTO42DRAFT_6984 [Malbranchea cinnamomea]